MKSGKTCTTSVLDLVPDRPDWEVGCRIAFNTRYIVMDDFVVDFKLALKIFKAMQLRSIVRCVDIEKCPL